MAGSSLTKMHFISAAQIVKDLRAAGTTIAATCSEESFIALFREYNPKFDVKRFREACQVKK